MAERERENFDKLIQSLNGYKGEGKPGIPAGCHTCVGEGQVLGPSFAAFPGVLSGGWVRNGVAQTPTGVVTWDAEIVDSVLTH